VKSSALERITARRAPWFSLFTLSMVMQNQYLAAASNLVVQTKSGAIQGVNFGSVNQWRGIPYATAPVGNLRWRVPDSTYTLDGHPRWLSQLCAVSSPFWGSISEMGILRQLTGHSLSAHANLHRSV
jgi:hypothetical protein